VQETVMSPNDTFTIVSTGAHLVEVEGTGQHYDRPRGLSVANGVPTIAPACPCADPVRWWRVAAPPSVRTRVTVTSLPLLTFIGVRRPVRADRWPRLSEILRRLRLVRSKWKEIDDGARLRVDARGGDLIAVTFLDR
jgi:hypothetical protein